MEHQVDMRDFKLLERDKYTFAVLGRILHGPCDLIMTDHESFILCHSAKPYPVWIWTLDGASDAEKENAWQMAQSARPLIGGFRYNLKYELAEYFIEKAKDVGQTVAITMNLFAYDCPAPITPVHLKDGRCECCTEAAVDEVAGFIKRFREDVSDNLDRDTCFAKAREHIANRTFFLWRDDSEKAVACCSYRKDGDLACIANVYTMPDYRRRHYAQNLVYQVTKLLAEKGLQPMLYTDADYAASNACYEKIGYKLKGKLCTIALQK